MLQHVASRPVLAKQKSVDLTVSPIRGQVAARLHSLAKQAIREANHREDGSSLVEFAVVMPVLLLFLTGMMAFGLALNNYLQLTDAVRIGAEAAAIARGTTTDPCSTATTAANGSASTLTTANIVYSFSINGTSYAGSGGTSETSCTGAVSNMLQGKQFQMTATYPCSLVVFGVMNSVVDYNSSGCKLTAQTAELIQ